jgi:invasion protein IalB
MLRYLMSLSTLALIAVTPPATAQQTQNNGLDLGQPVDTGTPQLGQRYSKDKFGDWDLACIKTEEDKDPCSLMQILKDESGSPIAEFSLFRLEGGGQAIAAATVVVPLETLLTALLTISIDGAGGKRYNYSFCNQLGCVAQIGLTASDIDAMVKGKEATISLVPAVAPDQVVTLKMPLSGFTVGYSMVDVVKN